LKAESDLKEAAFNELLASSSEILKDSVMSTLDIYIEKGIEKGRQETEEKKNYEFVKSLLLAGRFTSAKIAKFASVSEEYMWKRLGLACKLSLHTSITSKLACRGTLQIF
jgi:hypothetical protein